MKRLRLLDAGRLLSARSIIYWNRGEALPAVHSMRLSVEVARLAGLPETVVERARQILRDLEEQSAAQGRAAPPPDVQLGLFEFGLPHPVVERLRVLDVDGLTPIQALNLLAELAKSSRS